MVDRIIDCFNFLFSNRISANNGSGFMLANSTFPQSHDGLFHMHNFQSDGNESTLTSIHVGDFSSHAAVHGVDFFSDGNSFVTCSGKTIKMWNTEVFDLVRSWQVECDARSVKITPDDTQIVVGYLNGSISIFSAWVPNDVQELSIHRAHWGGLNSMAVIDNNRLISVGVDQRCCLWDLATAEKLATMVGNDIMTCVCVTADGTKAITGAKRRGLFIWDLNHSTLIGGLGRTWGPEVWSVVAFPHDDALVASCTATASVCVWNVLTMSLVHTLESRCGAICVLRMSPQGEHLVGGGYQLDSPKRGMLQVWDVSTHEVEKEVACPDVVCSIGLAGDYNHIFVGDANGFVHTWAATTTIMPK